VCSSSWEWKDDPLPTEPRRHRLRGRREGPTSSGSTASINVEDLLNSLHSAGDGRCGKSDYQYTCGGEGPLDSVEMHTDAEIEAGIIAAFVAEGGREDMVAAFREAVRKVREASDGSA
jgi:hypothetical protein